MYNHITINTDIHVEYQLRINKRQLNLKLEAGRRRLRKILVEETIQKCKNLLIESWPIKLFASQGYA